MEISKIISPKDNSGFFDQVRELEDHPWFPEFLRNAQTDFIGFAVEFLKIYKPIVPHVYHILSSNNLFIIEDRCSGAGGPVRFLRKNLPKHIKYFLSDLYPNIPSAMQLEKESQIEYRKTPKEGLDLETETNSLLTFFNAFHHFSKRDQENFLKQCVRDKKEVFIAEILSRNFLSSAGVFFLAFPGVFLLTPFIKPFSFRRLIFTYLIPIIPFLILWDGIISILKVPDETRFREIISNSREEGYHWSYNKIKGPWTTITYLYGGKTPLSI